MRKRKIGFRLLVSIISIIIVLIFFTGYESHRFFSDNFQAETDSRIEAELHDFEQNIERMSEKGVYCSSLFSELQAVKRAYENYEETKDLGASVEILETEVRKINTAISSQIGNKAKVHFHLAPAKSFFRSWSEKRGDDLSGFRKSILEVYQTKQAKTSIEAGRGGLFIRGISPIFSDKREYLGSVEMLLPIEDLIKIAKSNKDEDFAIYLNSQHKKLATIKKNDKQIIQQKLGNFSFLAQSSPDMKINLLHARMFNNALVNGTKVYQKEDYKFAIYPLYDYSEKIAAVIVYQLNVKKTIEKNNRMLLSLFLIGILSVIIAAFLLRYVIKRQISNPLEKISKTVRTISTGKLPEKLNTKREDEIGSIYQDINKLIDGRKHTTSFAGEIGKGNLNSNFTTLGKKDALGNALLEMQKNLKEAEIKEQKRKKDDQKQNWITNGLATFGDILRKDNDNIEKLANEIIINLVDFMKASQGGLFIKRQKDTNEIEYNLLAMCAFNKKKSNKKTIKLNEGLVGMCAREGETIYLTEVPKEYIEIQSGLGDATPNCILIVPLKTETEVLGIIEIASFNVFEKYQIEFVEKIAENIASTLSIASINSRTSCLLEQSQHQAKVLENMREELETRESELRGFVQAVNHSTMRAEFSIEGEFIYGNSKFMEVLKQTSESANKEFITTFLRENKREFFLNQWIKLGEGGKHIEGEIEFINTDKESVWVFSTFTLIRDKKGVSQKILLIGFDSTKEKQKNIEFSNELRKNEEEASGLVNAVNHSNIRVDIHKNGTLIYGNTKFLEIMEYTSQEVMGQHFSMFLEEKEKLVFQEEWKKLIRGGKHIEKEIKYKTKFGEIWIYGTYTSVRNRKGNVVKILFLGFDVTKHKEELKKLEERIEKRNLQIDTIYKTMN